MTIKERIKVTFSHKGYECNIINRLDLRYLYQVHGYNKEKDMDFCPRLLFDMPVDQIQKAAIAILDGTFRGIIELYGGHYICVSLDI